MTAGSGGPAAGCGRCGISELLAEAIEFVVVLEVDDELAAAAAVRAELDFQAEGVAELLFERGDIVALGSRLGARTGNDRGVFAFVIADLLADDSFHVANAEAIGFDALGE